MRRAMQQVADRITRDLPGYSGERISRLRSILSRDSESGRQLRAASPDHARAVDAFAALIDTIDGAKRRMRGFDSLAENLIAIAKAERGDGVDPRLVRAPTGASIGDPAGGGFLVAPQYATELLALAYENSQFAHLCDTRQTNGPLSEIKIPGIDETSRADGSRFGGALAYWSAEGATISPKLPRFKNLEFASNKLIALCYGTNELMKDAALFSAHIKRAFAAEIGFKLDAAILSGSTGTPLGIIGAPGTISAAKETGQAASTIVAANITNMFKRLPGPSRSRAVWLAHEDIEGLLDDNSFPVNLYQPRGANGSPVPLLKGRPVIPVEQCNAIGTEGDLVLADLGHYVIIEASLDVALSAHARFVEDEVIWRFVLRVDGKPAFASPITPYKGSATKSPFVTLASRA